MPIQFPIPSRSTPLRKCITAFGGVDFTGTPLTMSETRSPDARNFTKDHAAVNVKRPGYARFCTFEGENRRGNGLWAVEDVLIAHSGSEIYCITASGAATLLFSAAPDRRSCGVILEGRLLVFTGERCILIRKIGGAWQALWLDEAAYAPITSRLRNADGSAHTPYEPRSLLTARRVNAFAALPGAGESLTLECPAGEGPITARVLQADGSFTLWPEYDESIHLGQTGTLTADRAHGTVTFNSAASGLNQSGVDRVFIEFEAADEDAALYEAARRRINRCTIAELFGAGGNTDRIFASGNAELPAFDFCCAPYEPAYWPETGMAQVGTSAAPIIGYSRTGTEQLIIHKSAAGGEIATWCRTGKTDASGQTQFTVFSGGMAEPMLTPGGSAVLEGESLYLSAGGVRAVSRREQLTVQEYVMPVRSVYINGRLLEEPDLAALACACVFEGKYYLAVGDHMYVADPRFGSRDPKAGGTSRQFEWYFWDHIGAAAMAVFDGFLTFITHRGQINRFIPGQHWDYDESLYSRRRPVEMYWCTPHIPLEPLGTRKTVRHFAFIPSENNVASFAFGYVRRGQSRTLRQEGRQPFSFETLDFATLNFSSAFPMQVYGMARTVRNADSIQVFFKSDDEAPGGFHALEILYTPGRKVRE